MSDDMSVAAVGATVIKLLTRSLVLRDDDMMLDIARSIIEAYIQASREILMPQLISIEKQVHNRDVSFLLVFGRIEEVGDRDKSGSDPAKAQSV